MISTCCTYAMQGGPALPSLSTCSTDSRQDYVSTIESRSRGGRPPRRAAAAAALEHNHFVFGSPSPNGATDASPSPVVLPTCCSQTTSCTAPRLCCRALVLVLLPLTPAAIAARACAWAHHAGLAIWSFICYCMA